MKSGYAPINNFQRRGELGISHTVFESVASRAVSGVPGAKVGPRSRRWMFFVTNPIRATVRNNGQVDIAMDVIAKSGTDVQATCLKIQQDVTAAIALMCETIPVQVSVRVVGVQ